jgi:hypothetical protein
LLWQVTPLSRPSQAARVIHEFREQSIADRKLCLVVNSCDCEPVGADLVLRSAPGKPAALNAALAALPGELIAIRDDDDISLPGDLAECVDAMVRTGAEIVRRLRHEVLLDGERWLFAENEANQWGKPGVWGGSLLFRNTPDVPQFLDELVTESQSWAREMVKLGARIWRPSIRNQAHVRSSFGGMWGAGPLEIRRTLGFKQRARRCFPDGSFEWVDSPSAQDVGDEVIARSPLFGNSSQHSRAASNIGDDSSPL